MKKLFILLSFLFLNSILYSQTKSLVGIYKYGGNDIIALYDDGTGKFSLPTFYGDNNPGIVDFKWKFRPEYNEVELRLSLTQDQSYIILSKIMSFKYIETVNKQVLSRRNSIQLFNYE